MWLCLTPEKVAEILGFSPYEISVLMRFGLLKPLGKLAPNAHKYFCASEILELSFNHLTASGSNQATIAQVILPRQAALARPDEAGVSSPHDRCQSREIPQSE